MEGLVFGPFGESDEGYNLHAATTTGAADRKGREALLRYILRPPVAQESPLRDHEARRIVAG